MDAPNRPANRSVLTIVVGLGVVALGMAAIALVGPGAPAAALRPPEQIGDLHRTPSEEVSTPNDMIATYTDGSRVVVLSVTRDPNAGSIDVYCLADVGVDARCTWSHGDLTYTLVDSAGSRAALDLASQALHAVEAVNHR